MSQQTPQDGKADFSNLPRGAIGIKGFPVSRNTRLPSIRSPRDLTLGAQPKRNFVPNIPVRREKKPPVLDKESTTAKPEIHNKHSRNNVQSHERGRGRGRGRGREIVQTHGSVFGDGIAASSTLHPQKDKRLEASKRAANSGFKSSTSVKLEKNFNEDKSMDMNDVLDSLLRDDFIEFEEENGNEMKPIIFPFPDFMKKEQKIKEEIKTRMLEKDEKNEFEEMATKIKQEVQAWHETSVETCENTLKKSEKPEKPIPDLLSNNEPVLLLLQFPNCVAIPPKNEELDKYPSRKDPKTSTEVGDSNEEKNASNETSLSNMSEGYIGKLQILKSGEKKLILGSLVLNLEEAMPLRAKHEVAYVRTNVTGGDMTILGHVYQKLKCTPNVDTLMPS